MFNEYKIENYNQNRNEYFSKETLTSFHKSLLFFLVISCFSLLFFKFSISFDISAPNDEIKKNNVFTVACLCVVHSSSVL